MAHPNGVGLVGARHAIAALALQAPAQRGFAAALAHDEDLGAHAILTGPVEQRLRVAFFQGLGEGFVKRGELVQAPRTETRRRRESDLPFATLEFGLGDFEGPKGRAKPHPQQFLGKRHGFETRQRHAQLVERDRVDHDDFTVRTTTCDLDLAVPKLETLGLEGIAQGFRGRARDLPHRAQGFGVAREFGRFGFVEQAVGRFELRRELDKRGIEAREGIQIEAALEQTRTGGRAPTEDDFQGNEIQIQFGVTFGHELGVSRAFQHDPTRALRKLAIPGRPHAPRLECGEKGAGRAFERERAARHGIRQRAVIEDRNAIAEVQGDAVRAAFHPVKVLGRTSTDQRGTRTHLNKPSVRDGPAGSPRSSRRAWDTGRPNKQGKGLRS